MGRTIYEKILARTSGKRDVRPGEIVWVKPDVIATTDLNWCQREKFLEKVGLQKVPKPEKIVAVVDHHIEQLSQPEGAEHLRCFREWSRKNQVTHFYDSGRGGLQTQVLAEYGHVRPGMMVISDDPEAEACGGLGAFVRSSNQLMWMAIAIDEVWVEVPEVVKYHLKGRFERGVMSIDLRYKLHRELGEAFEKFVEFSGPAVAEMSIDARMNLCSSLYLSGSYGIIAPDRKTIEYSKGGMGEFSQPFASDLDVDFAGVYEYDVSELEPQIAFPPSPTNTNPVSEAAGIKIHQACVGSCASGRMEDLGIVADILEGRKVHPEVRMLITPVSQKVYMNALEKGLISIFVEAGALVCIPSCGTCPGHIGRLAAGEVCVTTGTVNYPGRMGSKEGQIYLASPATAAASAVEGTIADPRKFL
jgi:3-isopropylmalate/(R)-2-methylmalate dehydratase large subunit